MIDKEMIKAIIKQYADRGERLYNESYKAKVDSQAISYWDGYRDCANLLLRELDDMQEVCMYSKDNFTDEDRKVLCDGCEEECEFNKKEEPVNDSFEAEVKKLWMEINTGHSYSIVDSYNIFYGLCMDIAEWQKQKDSIPVSEDLKQEINAEWNCYSKDGQFGCINRFSFELIARHFANWQKQKDSIPISKDLEEASKEWLRPQLDKSYANYGEAKMMELTHFDGYAMLDAVEFGANWQKQQILDSNTTLQRTFELGKQEMKQQMMAKAVDGKIYETQARSKLKAATTGKISSLDYKVGDKVKVIIIKQEAL